MRGHIFIFCRRQAPIAAVFAGSPQLMGVIKLCTGWMVTNLPLYNDEDLQKRNENVSGSLCIIYTFLTARILGNIYHEEIAVVPVWEKFTVG